MYMNKNINVMNIKLNREVGRFVLWCSSCVRCSVYSMYCTLPNAVTLKSLLRTHTVYFYVP